jgi:predicted alpha/beta superfamily hydrolase
VSSPDTSLRTALRRFFRLENRRAAVRPGRIEHVSDLGRELTIYLPAGYDERDGARYPVLYMHDGQNLFDEHRAFIPGQHWRLQEAADEAIGERTAMPMIIVGIDHAGPARIDEYTPTRDPKHPRSGQADVYAKLLLETFKPAIEKRYRTNGESYVGGSSLGGLISLYLLFTHADVFRGGAILSPSIWWNGRSIIDVVEAFEGRPRPRIWLDIGGREGAEALNDARILRDLLAMKGWGEEDLRYYEDRRADHSERSWAKRVRLALEFLFPPA